MSNTSTPINLISKLKEQAQKNKTLRKIFPKEDKRKLHKLVTGQSFDFFIMSIILADALVLGMMTSDFWNLYFDQGLFLLDRLFMGIFIVEMFLKIYAERRDFFRSGWNIFDFIVIAVSILPSTSGFIILRTFRLFRLFKYIHHLSRLHNIVQTFIDLLPTFASFVAVFGVVFYVFAIMGVSLYGDIFASFDNLGSAAFTLLQIFTLDGWASTIARPIMLIFPYAWLYFSSLIILSFLLIISFVATVVRQVLHPDK